MKFAFDLDNTIDAAPHEMQTLMSVIKASGHWVAVVTGTASDAATQDVWQAKANYLNSLGCGACWNSMTVLTHTNGDLPTIKAQWLVDNGFDVLIDNDKDNAKAATAAGIPLVLVPWASRS